MTDALEVRIWNDYGRNISAPCMNADNLLAVSCHEAGAVVQILTQPGHSDLCVLTAATCFQYIIFRRQFKKHPLSCIIRLLRGFGILESFLHTPQSSFLVWFFHPSPHSLLFDLGFKGESPCRLNKSWITKERWTVENLWRAYTTCVRAFVRAYEYVQRSKRPTGINEVSICPLGPDERADVCLRLL